MNIPKLMNINLLIFMKIFLFASCKLNADKADVKDIIIAKEVKINTQNFVESDDSPVMIGDRLFALRYKAHYEEGKIHSLVKYSSEGVIRYTKTELKSDSLILNNIKLPNNQKYYLTDKNLLKINSSERRVIRLDSTHFMEERDKNVIIYCI